MIECEAHEIAARTLPLYIEVLRFTELDKSIDVAGLLLLLDTSRGFEKLRRYTGHFSVRRVTRTGKYVL